MDHILIEMRSSAIMLTIFLCLNQPVSAGSNNELGTIVPTEIQAAFTCPQQYIGALAQCPDTLECISDDNCAPFHICCVNLCGSKTCVYSWQAQGALTQKSGCDSIRCVGQGRECKEVNGIPSCDCIEMCGPPTTNEDFVCANNGMTYFTPCFMDKEACNSGITISRTTCNSIPTPNTILRTSSDNNNRMDSDQLQPPTVLSVPGTTYADEYDDVIFICDVTGNPQPAIFWQNKNNAIFMKPGENHGRISVSPMNGELRISSTRAEDSGMYTCHAANKGGVVSVKFPLKIQARRIIIPSRGGRSSRVDCETFPREQAMRCDPQEKQRKIKRLWVYRRETRLCKREYFRDCSAITNKFPSWTDCANSCMDICSLSPKKGTCRRFELRVFFDSETGRCRPFSYSGCEGNSNNFRNVYECRDRCPSAPLPQDPVYPMTPVSTPPPNLCPPCYQDITRAVCQSDFIIVGIIKHDRLDATEESGQHDRSRYIQVQLTNIINDSSSLELQQLNLDDAEDANIEIKVTTDSKCPCPNLRDIIYKEAMNAAIGTTSTIARRSRRIALGNSKVIIVGRVMNGAPILGTSGFVEHYSDKYYSRIKSILKSRQICSMLTQFP